MICECSISSLRRRAPVAWSTVSWAGRKPHAARANSRIFIWDQDIPTGDSAPPAHRPIQVWQEAGKKADHGQEGTDLVHEADAGAVDQRAEQRRANAA